MVFLKVLRTAEDVGKVIDQISFIIWVSLSLLLTLIARSWQF